jgi:cysteine desulfurase
MEAMLPYYSQFFGNPSSIHMPGQRAEAAVENSREKMAEGLHCAPQEVIFTSCGSESDNLALRGAALAASIQRNARHLLISPVEHPAVTQTARHLSKYFGFELEWLPVDAFGAVDPESVSKRLRPDTALVSVMYANNEIGTINPIAEIGAVCRNRGIPFHTDAVQAAAYLPVDVEALNVDLLSLGAHKFYGPKGIGALFVRKGTPLLPIQTGGSQEHGLRAGTSNTPYIVGMAKAFELAQQERTVRSDQVRPLRDRLIGQILETISEVQLTGHPTLRLPNHASFVLRGVDGNHLLMLLDLAGFACSSGSACKTGSPEPSGVITALGYAREWALGSLRLTLGSATTTGEIEQLIQALPEIVERERAFKTRPGIF